MNEKLQKILEGVLQDEAESSRFAELKTVDDMYAYFVEKIPELSEEDFDDFIVEMMDGFAEDEESMKNIDVNSLADVAGGANLRTKLASGTLAVLSLLPAVGTGAGAVNARKASPKTIAGKKAPTSTPIKHEMALPVSQAAETTVESSTPVTSPAETKIPETSNKFPASKSWFKRHPIITAGGITLGAIVLSYFGAKKMGWIGGPNPYQLRLGYLDEQRKAAEQLKALRNKYKGLSNDQLFDQLGKLLKNKNKALEKIDDVGIMYNLLLRRHDGEDPNHKWTQSNEMRLAELKGKLSALDIIPL